MIAHIFPSSKQWNKNNEQLSVVYMEIILVYISMNSLVIPCRCVQLQHECHVCT